MGNLSTTPQKKPARRQAPSVRRERTLWERFQDDFTDAASRSMVGYGVRRVADWTDWKKREGETEEQHDRRITQAERNRRTRVSRQSAADPIIRDGGSVMGDVARGASSLVGTMLGGADPTYLVAPGGSAITRTAGQAVVNAGANASTQGLEMSEGVRDRFDAREMALETAVGGLFQGGVETARGVSRALRNRGARPAEEVVADFAEVRPENYTVSPEARRNHELGEPFRRFEMRDEAGDIVEYGNIYDDGPVTRYAADGSELPVTPAFGDALRSHASGNRRAEPRPSNDNASELGREETFARFDKPEVETTGRVYTTDEAMELIRQRQAGEGADADAPRQMEQADEGPDPNEAGPLNEGGFSREEPTEQVGNINLDRLNSTDDVADMLRAAQADVRPGRVQGHRETRNKADKLDLSEEDLLKSEGLQGLEAAALRSRDILKTVAEDTVSLISKFDDLESPEAIQALVRLATVSEHVQNTINGPAGRILNSFKINAKSVDAARVLTGAMATPRGRARVKKLMDTYRNDPDRLAKIARDAVDPTLRDHIFSFRYNMMLSSPKTHFYNILGSASNIVMDIAAHGLGAVFDIPKGMMGNTDRITGREVAARLVGAAVGARAGLKTMKQAYAEGRPLDELSRADMERGRVGNWEVPVKLMSAEDEMFRSIAYVSNQYGQAVRTAVKEGLDGDDLGARIQELIDDPTRGMETGSEEYAKRMRFQDNPSAFGQMFEQLRVHKKSDGPYQGAFRDGVALVFPFIRTPDSLARTAVRYSPLGMFEGVNWADLKAGGARRSLALSRLTLGSAVTAAVAMKVLDGEITGEGPRDYKKRQQWELEGWQANSIKVGDKYYSYMGLEPLSIVLNGTATTLERWDEGDDKDFWTKSGQQVFNAAEVLTNQSWTESMSDFFDALDSPEGQRGAAINNFFANIASSFAVPAVVRGVNQSYVDPVQRDTRGDDSLPDRVANRIKAGYPGLSDDLPAQLDALGRPIGRGDAIGPDILSRATPPMTVANDVTRELSRLGVDIERVDKTVNTKDYPMGRLSALEQHNYQLVTGTYFSAMMEEALQSEEYQAMTDDEKAEYVDEAMSQSREWAREEVFSEPEANDGAENSAETGAEQEVDEGEDFTFGIPTSMRRTEAGNRNVDGAENSLHLDGDAVDFVPAPGVSFETLLTEAQKFFGPSARVAIHGRGSKKHVHVEISGLDAPLYGERGTI